MRVCARSIAASVLRCTAPFDAVISDFVARRMNTPRPTRRRRWPPLRSARTLSLFVETLTAYSSPFDAAIDSGFS